MSKKKFVIIGIVAILLVGVGTFALTYLFAYKNNDDEIVKFGSKIKVNIDDDFYLYDVEANEIVEDIHFVCKGEGKIRDNQSGSHDKLAINIKSKTLSTLNMADCICGFYETEENYVSYITFADSVMIDDKLETEFSNYIFYLVVDKSEFDNFIIKVYDQKDKKNYVVVKTNNSSEAKELAEKLKVY